ncbi:MAG: FxLYD domain-containing protein [Dehalococcoidales bacterium]|nr:FxLYD domain-containing protein [Dehalococcoidales bacterium]
MSEKENLQEVNPTPLRQNEEDLDSVLVNFNESCGEGEPSPEKLAEMARKAPDPIVTGNEQVEILSHSLILKKATVEGVGKGVAFTFKNNAGASIGKLVFEAVLFDAKGNIIDTIERGINDFEADKTYSLRIMTGKADSVDIVSYDVHIKEMVVTPVPQAEGDQMIVIIRHSFQDTGLLDVGITEIKRGIELAIRNVSGQSIASAIFAVDLFDAEGNYISTLKHTEPDIQRDTSRAFLIQTTSVKDDIIRSYNVKLIKTVTAELEKVQLRRNEVKRLPNGREELSGLLKNVSSVKTDAVVVVTYLDANEEPIGVRTLEVRDINPGTVQKFALEFTCPEGLAVKKRDIDIGELAEAEAVAAA